MPNRAARMKDFAHGPGRTTGYKHPIINVVPLLECPKRPVKLTANDAQKEWIPFRSSSGFCNDHWKLKQQTEFYPTT